MNTAQTPHGMPLIDVRLIAPRERHARIFATFEQLPVGGWIDLLSDHEPLPLKAQFQAQWTGQFDWEVMQAGPLEWRTRIGRRPQAKTCCGSCGG
jgi:uncharacterized protein (DUF2249 family)